MASQCRALFYLLAALSGIVFGEAIAYRSFSIAWFWPPLFFLTLPLFVFKRGLISRRALGLGACIATLFCVYTAGFTFISVKHVLRDAKQGLSTFQGTLEKYVTYEGQVRVVIRLDHQDGARVSLFSKIPINNPLGTHGVVTASLRPIQHYLNHGGSDRVRAAWRQGIVAEGELKHWQIDRTVASPSIQYGEVRHVYGTNAFLSDIRRALTRLNQSEGQAFLSAMIFGEMSAIPSEIRETWKRMGIYHLVVVSGLHLMIFYGMGYVLFYGMSYFIPRLYHAHTRQDWAMCAGSAMSLIPCFIYPETASLLRGILALTLVSLLRYLRVPMNGVLLASAVCLIYLGASPAALYDLSFQLTFLCVFSIVLLGPIISEALGHVFAVSYTNRGVRIFSASLATTLALAPLVAPLQGRLYLAGLILNMVAIPLFIAVLTPLVIISVCLFPWYSEIFIVTSRVIDWVFDVLMVVYRACDYSLPNPFSTVDSALLFSLGLLGIAIIYILYTFPMKYELKSHKIYDCMPYVGVIACFLALFFVEGFLRYPKHFFYITLFDVGQGESLLLENKGEILLIDAGGSGSQIGSRVIVPAIHARGVRYVDRLLLSHPDLDHYGGMQDLLERLSVNTFLWTGARSRDSRFDMLLETLKRKNVRLERVSSETRDQMLGDVSLNYLHPHLLRSINLPSNSQSLVLKASYGNFSALFTGDSDRLSESTLMYGPEAENLSATLLKIPHHGSESSSQSTFIDRVSPKMAWVSAGRVNRFGHPRETVMARYERRGIHVFRTDQNGEVTLRILKSNDDQSHVFYLSTFLREASNGLYFPFFD